VHHGRGAAQVEGHAREQAVLCIGQRQAQAGQRLDADGQQVGALAQAHRRIGYVAPVRVGHQHGCRDQAQRQRAAGQQPEKESQPGQSALLRLQRHGTAVGELQRQPALLQH
jgi:hypothetical protein